MDIELVRSYIHYEPETGSFTWSKDKERAKKGASVGWIDALGYRRTKFSGVMIVLHRMAWEFHFGKIPDGFEVDHVDGCVANNRINNLRLATKAENMRNSKIRVTNKNGVKGVDWNKHHGKFQVQIMKDLKKIHGGYFPDIESAKNEAMRLREIHHSIFCRHG